MRFFNFIAAGIVASAPVTPSLADSDYMCTGVGLDSREQAEQADYSLKLVFAEPDGHFLADVDTRITGADGTVLVDATCDAPWLLVDLPRGRYEVTATFHGESKTQTVSIGNDAKREQLFTF